MPSLDELHIIDGFDGDSRARRGRRPRAGRSGRLRMAAMAHTSSLAMLAPAPRFVLAVVCSALGAASAVAQVPSQAASPTVLPSTAVEVVRLEASVVDKQGRPRTDLRQEDFVVLEDGQPQPIVQFQAFARPGADRGSTAEPTASAEETEEADDAATRLPSRYIVLAIDDVHMEFDSLVRARRAIEGILTENLREEDQVALVTTSGTLALSQEFTSERASLRQVLSRLSAQGRRVSWTGVPRLTEYQAELIESGDPLALDAAVQEILQDGISQGQATAEEMARSRAREVLNEAVANSRLSLEALEGLCRGLSGLGGRKALFFISDGFLTGLSARSDTVFDLRRIADAATRAGVVIYALDTRGLLASPPALGASSPTRPMPAVMGLFEAMRSRSVEATRASMHALAEQTGGFLVESSNNLRAGLRAMLEDSETYYVLAYEPTNTKRDGGYRRIEVRLPGQPGLEVRTRSGYFAPDDRRLAAASSPGAAVRQAQQRRAELRAALVSLAPLTGIPIRFSADFVRLEGAAQVVISGVVDVGGLPFTHREDRREAAIDTSGLVYDERGRVALLLDTERSLLGLTEADYERIRRTGLPYTRAATLPPGRYQVRLAARDEATGLLGSAWQRVDVPDLSQGRLAVSGLFLLEDAGAALTDLPAPTEAGPVLRSRQASRRFPRDRSLFAQIEIYNAGRAADGTVDLSAQAAVLRGGAVLAQTAPEPLSRRAEAGVVTHVSRIPLQRFEPGTYELRMTITDRRANASASRRVEFVVE